MHARVTIPATHQTGDAGLHMVEAQFGQLGWGPVENRSHDFGIDLFLFVRDAARVEIGRATAQVKSGPSYFSVPAKDPSGAPIGWHYREADTVHLDYWLAQPTPHLLVLHDPEQSTSFWEVIAPQNIQRTGKGWKILVPRTNTLSTANLSDLLRAFTSTSAQIAGEGAQWWSSESKHSLADRRRLALMAPRAIAPHPNRGFGQPVDQPSALALLMLGRQADLFHFVSQHSSVPSLEQAASHRNWDWRFVAATAKWIETGETDLLIACCAVRGVSRRAAATAVTAAALLDQGSIGPALDLLDLVLRSRSLDTVDRAWLLSHKGRLESELGRDEEARKDLEKAERLLESRNDLDVRGVLAAVKSNLWRVERAWTVGHLGDLVTHADNRVLWWRAMGAGFQLADQFGDLFDERIGRYANSEVATAGATSRSATAWLNATILGDHSNAGGWQASAAKVAVASGSIESEGARSALLDLHRSGSAKDLSALASYLWQVGPTGALRETVRSSIEASLTRTTLLPTLELLRVAPDLAGRHAARAADMSVRGLVGADQSLRALAPRGTTPWYEFGQTASALLPWVGLRFHREVAMWLLGALEGGYPGPLEAQLIERLCERIRWSELSRSVHDRVAKAARGLVLDDVVLAGALVRGLDREHPGAAGVRSALQKRAMDGDIDALMQLIEPDAGRAPRVLEPLLASTLQSQTERIRTEARGGRHTYGGYRFAVLQAWFSLSHAPSASWSPVLSLLGDPAVVAEHKIDVCTYLADHSDDLPADLRDQLASLLPNMRSAEDVFSWSGEHLESHVVRLRYRIGAVSAGEAIDHILEWACSASTQDRRAAAKLSAEDLGWSIGQASAWVMRLMSDPAPRVSLMAARSMGVLLPGVDPPTLSLLDRMVRRDELGCGRSLALVRGLREAKASKKALKKAGSGVLAQLERHSSRAVRRGVADLLGG